jgi:secreted trypsin-like serine protease
MTTNKFIRDPRCATLVAALVAAMVVSFFVFVQSGEARQAVPDKQSPYASITPWIIGGTEVPNGKYPFMVLLQMTSPKGGGGNCGGTLIDRDSVLTAAHCFYSPTTGKNLLEDKLQVEAFVGRTVRSSNQGHTRFAKWVSTHPDYKGIKGLRARYNTYDAAVIELRRPVWGITPIKLATSKQNNLEKPGRNATVAGWGNTIASSPYDPEPPGGPEIPDRMHEAQVPIVSDSSAKQALDPRPETRHTRGIVYSPPLMIAAGGKGKDDICHGDSGGPLFFALGDNGDDGDDGDDGENGGSSGKYTQIGITSFFTGGCAYKYFPVAYTEVNNPKIRNWIISAARR